MAKKSPTNRGGWFELPDISGKAPIHKAVANKKNTIGLLRTPMVKRESKWTDETIINELKKIRSKLHHFPIDKELRAMGRTDLAATISKHGGFNKFRLLLNEEIIQVDKGFWADKTIINELKKIRSELGHFPSQKELSAMGKSGLGFAISKHGSMNKFRHLLNEEIIRTDAGFWTDETIINELKKIRSDRGYFPTKTELEVDRTDLTNAIKRHRGMNKFRLLLNEEIIRNDAGFWTNKTIIKELKEICADFHHFPTVAELRAMDNGGLVYAIIKHGGMNKFRKALGYSVSVFQEYISELASYTMKRGKKTEQIIMKILEEWCKEHGKPLPSYNVHLAKGKVIEFVCDAEKKIGIDVTNTESKSVVYRKWSRKKYQKHLDELWVVVFSDIFTKEDYDRWNEDSSSGVKVLSIYEFLEELDYAADKALLCKIGKYCACSFRTKEELKQRRQQHRQMTFEDLL